MPFGSWDKMAEESWEKLFEEYREKKDVVLRDRIFEKYAYIAEILAKKFVGRGVEYDDLFQVASLALLKGIDRFDPTLGMQFSTFITPTITGEIKNYFRDKSRMVKLPRRLTEVQARVKAYCGKAETETGKKPTAKEIAAALCLSEEEVLESLEISGTLSLDTLANQEEQGDGLYGVLPVGEDSFERFETGEALKNAVATLSETERQVVKYRFQNGLSQSEVAKRLGVSQMFVSRMEAKVIKKLRDYFKEE